MLAGVIIAAVTVALVAQASPAAAALTTYCSGTGGAVIVPGDLIVAAGNSCELDGTTITGDVTVRAGANLLTDQATIKGDLVVRADGFAGLERSTVAGDLRAQAAYGVFVTGSDLGGTVNARRSGFLYSHGTVHAGQVVSNEGATLLESSWISDQVRTNGDEFADLFDTVVVGEVRIAEPVAGVAVCATEIDGTTRITGATGPVGVGADSSGAACGSVVFAADVHLNGNTGGVTLADTVVRGRLACADNTPGPVGENVRVRGKATGQCQDLSGPENAAESLATQPSVEDRRTAVTERIEERTGAAEEEALEAGPAF